MHSLRCLIRNRKWKKLGRLIQKGRSLNNKRSSFFEAGMHGFAQPCLWSELIWSRNLGFDGALRDAFYEVFL